MRLLICLSPALAVAALAQTQLMQDARSLLIRSGGAALVSDTLHLEGTESSEIIFQSNTQTVADSFKLQRSGGRMRLETTSTDHTGLLVADGTYLWTYTSSRQTYTKSPHPNGPANDAFGRLKFSRDPADFSDPKLVREETVEFGGKPSPCYVVQAAYQLMPGNYRVRDVTRTVWIARSSDQIQRDIWDFTTTSSPPAKVRITTNYTVIEFGMPLPDDLFVFHPPEGSRELTTRAPLAVLNPTGPATIHEVKPEYSAEARAAGLQGTVSLYVEVKNDGRPTNIQVMQGLGLGLDQRALEAVRQWEFRPNSDPREVDVQFRLEQPGPWDVAGASYWRVPPPNSREPEIVKPVVSHYVAPDSAACQSPGSSVVSLLIGADGKTRDVTVKDGAPGALSDAAVKAVENWQFTPATAGGKAVEAHGEVELVCQPAGMILESDLPPLPIYRVGGGVSAPVLISKIEPQYSEEARQIKLQGSNHLYVQISPEGKVRGIAVVRRLGSGLDEKAMEAVKRWRFRPGMKDGKPVTVEATIEVNFKLL